MNETDDLTIDAGELIDALLRQVTDLSKRLAVAESLNIKLNTSLREMRQDRASEDTSE